MHYLRAIPALSLTIVLAALILFARPPKAQAAAIFNPFSFNWWMNRDGSPSIEVKEQQSEVIGNFLPSIGERLKETTRAKAAGDTVVAGWYTPWGDDSFNTFKSNLDVLTEIHPFVYTLAPDGVSLVEDKNEWHKAELIRLSKENGIRVIPTISADVDYSDLMLNDPAKRTAHIEAIMRTIEQNGYDGFDIDYEGFKNGYNRDVYAAFMRELSAKMHPANKRLTMAIEAFNTKQNWESFGESVDLFMIMGYDYHSAKTPEVGPIGPASWLKEVVDYAKTRVPAEKIVLGLGTYGYSWINDGTRYVSTAVGYQDALDIAAETGNSIARGQDNTPYFSYNRGAGTRYLYFEDAQSTRPKLEVVKEAGIGGIALWRLGNEDPAIWKDLAEVN